MLRVSGIDRQLLVRLFAVTLFASAAGSANAEDMSVYTTVSRVDKDNGTPVVVARSLTLFHAGKVYDYMEDIGEVVILEPIHNRFVILNSNFLAARVDFGELRQYLHVGEHEAELYLQELATSNDRESRRAAAALEFQLAPEFEESYEPTLQRLSLMSNTMSYEVRTARVEKPHLVQQYLTYADWAQRLNYVLHPHATFPAPRLELNESLRQKGLVPTRVDLVTRAGWRTLHLRAEHQIQLGTGHSEDKALIHKWEQLLDSEQIRWVTFPRVSGPRHQRSGRELDIAAGMSCGESCPGLVQRASHSPPCPIRRLWFSDGEVSPIMSFVKIDSDRAAVHGIAGR